jgi:hypothetical protein
MPPDAGSHEHGRMQNFVAALLRQSGALVEPVEPDGLDVLAPPPVQRALGIGEMSRLGFGATLPPAAQRVGIEGDWLERCARLLGSQGRLARRVLSPAARAPGDPERLLERELVLDNATFRLLGVAPAWTRYLRLDFRASSVSDDKRDFVLQLGVNLATGALQSEAMLAAMAPALDDPSPGSTRRWPRSSPACIAGLAATRSACTCITTTCTTRRCGARWPWRRATRGDSGRNSGRRRSGASIAPSSTTFRASMRHG